MSDYLFEPFDKEAILSGVKAEGKTLFYPGAGVDLSPIEDPWMRRHIRLYLYVDYLLPQEEALSFLLRIEDRQIDLISVTEKDLLPGGWSPHVHPNHPYDQFRHRDGYAYLARYERKDGSRYALLCLCADAFATYDALYLNEEYKTPRILLLHDHGFGCNYDHFGEGGLLHRLVLVGKKPKYLLVAPNTAPYPDYAKLNEPPALAGRRYLYRHKESRHEFSPHGSR